jgi:hypothetical protein
MSSVFDPARLGRRNLPGHPIVEGDPSLSRALGQFVLSWSKTILPFQQLGGPTVRDLALRLRAFSGRNGLAGAGFVELANPVCGRVPDPAALNGTEPHAATTVRDSSLDGLDVDGLAVTARKVLDGLGERDEGIVR